MLANSAKAARWLSTQHISVNVVVAKGLGGKPSERLREIALAHGCDLMVIGAYGRSPIRESLLGGVTADFLADPPLPLVMSH